MMAAPPRNARGLQALMRGTGQLSMQQSEQTKVVLHLGQAIDAQTKGNDTQAAEELEHALEAGFNHPALYFDLGSAALKRRPTSRSSMRHLQHAVKHTGFQSGGASVAGAGQPEAGQAWAASLEYLEALKTCRCNDRPRRAVGRDPSDVRAAHRSAGIANR